jgi:hypothetical protein
VSLILSWVLFPLVLALIGLGWGAIVERAAGVRVDDALVLPIGLAAALVLAGTLTAFTVTAPAAVPLVAVGAVAGLPLAWVERSRLGRWPLLAAFGVLLAYGAPILLSGNATFAGFVRLDDSATWFNVIDHVMSNGRSVSGEAPSTYSLTFSTDIGTTYPIGSFMLLGVARGLTGIDVAWVFQPYLACCGAAVSLGLYALIGPLVPSLRVRALIAFLAAQSALLYGYSLWGGIKELTAAFLLVLAAALAAAIYRRRPQRPRELIPLAIAAGALIQTLGVGAGGWVALIFAVVAGTWLWQGRRARELWRSIASLAWLGALTAVFVIPIWVTLSDFLSNDSSLFSSGQTEAARLGNLGHPLKALQLAGIWPVGDFRLTPPTVPTALLIGMVLLAAGGALWVSVRRRELDLFLYVAVALGGCALFYLGGATPWVIGKALAISAPALLAAALVGASLLWRRHRAGVIVLAALAFGVIWTNALAYNSVLLAPRGRLAELQQIGNLVADKGPTLLNEYEIYGDNHFLRAGAPTEPAEYRSVLLALRDGTLLTKSAWADLDSFPLSTLEEYRSILTRRSPAESRPPSNYRLVWQGTYYDLWQRPEGSTAEVIDHIPYGESNELPYCGVAQNARAKSECSVNPVATPPCPEIHELAKRASQAEADLVAYRRPEPIVARADQTRWPGLWFYDPASHALTANTPGALVSHIGVADSQRYELWLGGSFARGFEVSIEGHSLGRVKDQLSSIGGYVHVGDVELSGGVYKIVLTYPDSDLTPGSGDNSFTSLSAIALVPTRPPSRLVRVKPEQAGRLCGHPLDWIELVSTTP